jgi:hypothetical protein
MYCITIIPHVVQSYKQERLTISLIYYDDDMPEYDN